MPLTGQAKIDYQREYMRRYRSNQRSNVTHESVRPSVTSDVRPAEPEPQSHSPMMVGYVPPID
ncbi:hypothetical protein LCGC14_1858650 [marine sediment metagenome]|uniref:Uncharacterized protein n=1 Tax=marine sediment metagenome TaxID=412755 RepID=A0A0F9J792_9ZZZZ